MGKNRYLSFWNRCLMDSWALHKKNESKRKTYWVGRLQVHGLPKSWLTKQTMNALSWTPSLPSQQCNSRKRHLILVDFHLQTHDVRANAFPTQRGMGKVKKVSVPGSSVLGMTRLSVCYGVWLRGVVEIARVWFVQSGKLAPKEKSYSYTGPFIPSFIHSFIHSSICQ